MINLTNGPADDKNCFVFDGEKFQIGARVIRWDEEGGFNGYITKECVVKTVDDKTGKTKIKKIKGNRFSKRSAWGRQACIDSIKQLVVHHSGADRKDPSVMYDVLYKQRGLSVHFAVEDDGRIYQFNDALDCCWHAGRHNAISIGTECCLFPFVDQDPDYYSEKRRATSGNLEHKVATEVVHGREVKVYCFTEPQTESLAKLYAGCWFAIGASRSSTMAQFSSAPRFPRVSGSLLKTVISDAYGHTGLIGHLQITANKVDPAGLDWEKFEQLVGKYFNEYVVNRAGAGANA